MSGFGNLQPGYVEPIGIEISPKAPDYYAQLINHQHDLDEAFEVEPCAACSGVGEGLNLGVCKTCWGTKDVPLGYEQWRAGLCDQFAADVQSVIDDLTKSLASHDQQLYPDEAMVQLAQRAQQAAANAAKAWRASPDRRVVMQAVQQAGKG